MVNSRFELLRSALHRSATALVLFLACAAAAYLSVTSNSATSSGYGYGYGDEPPPSTPTLPPGELPFVATDLVFDPVRPYIYVADYDARAVYFVNRETLSIDRAFSLEYMPQTLSLTPGSGRLYVAMQMHPRGYNGADREEGMVAGFDLETQEIDQLFHINVNPASMAATDSLLVVSSASPTWNWLGAFDTLTGERLSIPTAQESRNFRLFLHPTGETLFGLTGASPTSITKLDILPSGLARNGSLRLDGPSGGTKRLWIAPHGLWMLGGNGDIYDAQPGSPISRLTTLAAPPFGAAAFDPTTDTFFTAGIAVNSVRFFNSTSLLQIGSFNTTRPVDRLGVADQLIYTIDVGAETTVFLKYPHPALDAAGNTPPSAAFAITPAGAVSTQTALQFDASISGDPQDALANLRFRWDIGDDGTWDTDWLADPVLTYQYELGGTKRVRLQVKDTFALVSDQLQTINVAFAAGTGAAGTQWSAFDLPFVASDLLFDPSRPYLYATSGPEKRLYFISLDTGLIEKAIPFDHEPRALAMSPDGSRLYVALLLPGSHSSSWEDGTHEAYIARVDLAAQTLLSIVHITEDPYDMLATADGQLIVSSASGQHTYVRVFDGATGDEISAIGAVFQKTRLALHPSGKRAYGANRGLTPSDIQRYDILSGNSLYYPGNSPYHGEYPMNGDVWVSPLGDRLFVAGGDVFTSNEDFGLDMLHVQRLTSGGIAEMAFDSRLPLAVTVEASVLGFYDLRDLQPLQTLNLAGAHKVGLRDNFVQAATMTANATVIRTFVSPLPDSDVDGMPDFADNCPFWSNPGQALPPWLVPDDDLDCDGSNAEREAHVGTDPQAHCNADSTANNEALDAWPPDFDDDQIVDLNDVLRFNAVFGSRPGDLQWNARFDLLQDTEPPIIDLGDVLSLNPYFGRRCAPPPVS